jgi:heavy metal translocating P-type ATPase
LSGFIKAGRGVELARPGALAISAVSLLSGLAFWLLGRPEVSAWLWSGGTIPVLAVLLVEIVVSLRRGDVGLDIVAALSMLAALIFGEHLAAVIVALMYSGGEYLESFAERRASRDMTALLARAPRTAVVHRLGRLEEVPLDRVTPGDRLLVRQGDLVPVDGTVSQGVAVLDQSALTGEPLPVQRRAGDEVMSGAVNVGTPFDMLASRRAADSTYAGIVRLVEAAHRSRAPMSRIADRYAIVFLVATVLLAGGAWAWTGDAIRAVAVLVVATPCPLILALPVAIVAGVSRAAKQGILIKGGKALEALARIRVIVVDKTGTLTRGRAKLVTTQLLSGMSADAVLRLAAGLDQASQHIIAQTLVEEAHERGLALPIPIEVKETPGEGVVGVVEGRRVWVGGVHFVARQLAESQRLFTGPVEIPGAVSVAVAVDGEPQGLLILADELRGGTRELLEQLKSNGIERIVLATGDRRDVAEAMTRGLPLDSIRAELGPDQKTLVVLAERKNGPVMMIGDGVNDAPALAAADLGLAMGAMGAAASAEAADVVLLVDQLDRVLSAIRIARRSRTIALESVYAGIGMSVAGMIAAACGLITPVEGAILQEIIDVAVILNALRALW